MCFLFRASVDVVCEGRLYGFQLRIALNGVKNAVKCVVQAVHDDSQDCEFMLNVQMVR